MKQENFTKIEKEISRNGCYLLCLCKIAEKYLQKELKEQDVLEIYLNAVKKNYIYSNCYVLQPQNVLNLIFSLYHSKKKCTISNVFNNKETTNGFADFTAKVKIKNLTQSHFVVVDNDKKVIYDPSSVIEEKAKKRGYEFINFRGYEII